MQNDWMNDDESELDARARELAVAERKMRTLGEGEGLKQGLDDGEKAGFDAGFEQTARRAFEVGRALGAARIVELARPNPSMADATRRLERAAVDGNEVDEDAALVALKRLLVDSGVHM